MPSPVVPGRSVLQLQLCVVLSSPSAALIAPVEVQAAVDPVERTTSYAAYEAPAGSPTRSTKQLIDAPAFGAIELGKEKDEVKAIKVGKKVACAGCRQAKRKCSNGNAGEGKRCDGCAKRGTECEFQANTRAGEAVNNKASEATKAIKAKAINKTKAKVIKAKAVATGKNTEAIKVINGTVTKQTKAKPTKTTKVGVATRASARLNRNRGPSASQAEPVGATKVAEVVELTQSTEVEAVAVAVAVEIGVAMTEVVAAIEVDAEEVVAAGEIGEVEADEVMREAAAAADSEEQEGSVSGTTAEDKVIDAASADQSHHGEGEGVQHAQEEVASHATVLEPNANDKEGGCDQSVVAASAADAAAGALEGEESQVEDEVAATGEAEGVKEAQPEEASAATIDVVREKRIREEEQPSVRDESGKRHKVNRADRQTAAQERWGAVTAIKSVEPAAGANKSGGDKRAVKKVDARASDRSDRRREVKSPRRVKWAVPVATESPFGANNEENKGGEVESAVDGGDGKAADWTGNAGTPVVVGLAVADSVGTQVAEEETVGGVVGKDATLAEQVIATTPAADDLVVAPVDTTGGEQDDSDVSPMEIDSSITHYVDEVDEYGNFHEDDGDEDDAMSIDEEPLAAYSEVDMACQAFAASASVPAPVVAPHATDAPVVVVAHAHSLVPAPISAATVVTSKAAGLTASQMVAAALYARQQERQQQHQQAEQQQVQQERLRQQQLLEQQQQRQQQQQQHALSLTERMLAAGLEEPAKPKFRIAVPRKTRLGRVPAPQGMYSIPEGDDDDDDESHAVETDDDETDDEAEAAEVQAMLVRRPARTPVASWGGLAPGGAGRTRTRDERDDEDDDDNSRARQKPRLEVYVGSNQRVIVQLGIHPAMVRINDGWAGYF